MTYIDKRALQNGESELSLIPYVNLNQVIQNIIDPQVFPTPSEDISFSTQEIGVLDISELNGQYFTALDLGVFSTTATLEDVAKDIPPCKFGEMKFTVYANSANEDIIVWLLSGEDIIGSITILSGNTGDFSVQGDFENPEYLSICFNITGGSGEVVISEITTTFTTGEPIIPPEPPGTLTAGDWLEIKDRIISFSGGIINGYKELICTQNIEDSGKSYTATSNTTISPLKDEMNFSIFNDTDNEMISSSTASFSAGSLFLETIGYKDGLSTVTSKIETQSDFIDLTVSDGLESNRLRVEQTDTFITAYPNTRNDYPTDPPVNLLSTDVNGKIQSFNAGLTDTISILGVTLKFANGILIEYTT